MRLERITIANFKGLREVQFEPTRFSCLVGENNAGKSTVLQAIVTARAIYEDRRRAPGKDRSRRRSASVGEQGGFELEGP